MTAPKPQNLSLSITRRIGVPAAELYRAWTDPKLMARWFAPAPLHVVEVEADPRVGGKYRIVVAEAKERHTTVGEYVELVPDRRIVKTWLYTGPIDYFGGELTLVTVDLNPLGEKLTELTLTHARLVSERAQRDTNEGWLLCLDSLEDTHAPEHRFTTTRTVKASVEEVYAAWTDPALMRKWFGTIVEANVRVGGRYRVENHEADGNVFKHKGEYRVLEPGRRIVKTFVFDGEGAPEYSEEYSDEMLTVSFRSVGPRRTEITLTNSWNGKAMTPDELKRLKEGWDEWIDRYEAGLARVD